MTLCATQDKEAMMKKGMVFAALTAALALSASSADAREQVKADGCRALENAVFAAVLAASDGARRPATPTEHSVAALRCADSARAVSKGFTRAMTERNVYFNWRSPDRQPMDMCLSGDLSQCSPSRSPYVGMSAGDAAFVADSWNAIRRAVGKTMPQGYAADTAVFAPSGMALTLDVELARGLRGRAQQSYYVH
jgi:hypothetical protein